jgi:hypothetical protein
LYNRRYWGYPPSEVSILYAQALEQARDALTGEHESDLEENVVRFWGGLTVRVVVRRGKGGLSLPTAVDISVKFKGTSGIRVYKIHLKETVPLS